MKKELSRKISIPKDTNVKFEDGTLTISKNGKTISKKLHLYKVLLKINDDNIEIYHPSATRRESTIIGTTEAHIKNMINGLDENYVYELEICNVHFPMNVSKENDRIVIKSFLGEKKDRYAKILHGVNVDISGVKITVSSNDKELAGQTAANMEKATRLVNKDRRIFQDGIFITNKCGRII